MRIYVHTPREWFELYEMGKRMFGCFIGHTGHDVIQNRFDDGDYSHFIEQPNVLNGEGWEVHPDIKDHWIHESLENETGWFRYNKLNELGRSPDFFVTDLPPTEAIEVIRRTVVRINDYFIEYEKKHGESPAKEKRKVKQRLMDYHRIPGSKLLDQLYNDTWSKYDKDAMIMVLRDAHGRICEYLLEKGFTNLHTDEVIRSQSDEFTSKVTIVTTPSKKFTKLIGNPPYDGGLYCDFMKIASDYLTEDGEFDLLLPSYTFTRKKSMRVCRDNVRLTSVDMTVGQYFKNVINGTWVARFRGTIGKTGDDEIDLTLTNGETIKTKLSDINPSSQKFIGPNGLTPVDYSIVRKVLTGSIVCEAHKTTPINTINFSYIRPTLKYVAKPHPAAGSFNLHGVCNNWTPDVKNGWYIETSTPEIAENVQKIYTESKLFNFVNWLMISDFPMVGKNYILSLPDVTKLTYKNETDLYEQFGLTDDEIARIESILG